MEHIRTKEVVVSGGMSEYQPGSDTSLHAVFERADGLMYEEKKLLKGMGAVGGKMLRQPQNRYPATDEGAEILNIKRHIRIAEDGQINQMILEPAACAPAE